MLSDYTDAIVACPNGFVLALNELYCNGLVEFLQFDEENVVIIGLKKIHRFYPKTPDFYSPAILYVRGENADIEKLRQDFVNINILITHPAGGGDIYQALMENPGAVATYAQYIYHEPVLADGSVNPVTQPTLIIEGDDGGEVEIENPGYQPIKKMGRFA